MPTLSTSLISRASLRDRTTHNTEEIAANTPAGFHPRYLVITLIVIAVMIVIIIMLLPTNWMVSMHDWVGRGFKRAPKPPHKPTPPKRRLGNEQRNGQGDEANSKTFLQRHLGAIRVWRKPKLPHDEEARPVVLAAVPKLVEPLPTLNRGKEKKFAKRVSVFQRWMKEEQVREDAGKGLRG